MTRARRASSCSTPGRQATRASRASLGHIAASLTLGFAVTACGGSAPLLHPARTLPSGEVRAATGVAAQIAPGALGDDLERAKAIAATSDPTQPFPPEQRAEYAKGALVAAAIAPGLSPVVGARVGVGARFEGGMVYTGRAVRADLRRSFDDGPWSLSLGLGGTAALFGREQGTDLPAVDLGSLRGYGLDLPVLVGWESDGGLYMLWAGARASYEHVAIERVTSEPKPVTLGASPTSLSADRFAGGGVVGFATGFNHVHVALELQAGYQIVDGTFAGTNATVKGLALSPASAVWWTF